MAANPSNDWKIDRDARVLSCGVPGDLAALDVLMEVKR